MGAIAEPATEEELRARGFELARVTSPPGILSRIYATYRHFEPLKLYFLIIIGASPAGVALIAFSAGSLRWSALILHAASHSATVSHGCGVRERGSAWSRAVTGHLGFV